MRTIVPAVLFSMGRKWLAAASRPSLVTVITAAIAHFTYVALLGILVIASLGLPIPEDIPLIMGGYCCNKEYSPIKKIPKYVDLDGDGIPETPTVRHVPNVYYMMLAGMAGVLIGDSIVFSIGRRGIDADNFVARHIRKVMHSKRREKVERHFAKHGNLTVFVGRFMPGFRSLIFAFAGMSRMSYFRFLLIDGIAAAISVPFFVYLGYHFAGEIESFLSAVEHVKHILLPIVMVIAAGAIAIYYVRRRRAAQAEALAASLPPADPR